MINGQNDQSKCIKAKPTRSNNHEQNVFTEVCIFYSKLSVVVAALKLCMPMVLVVIGYIEDWSPRFGFNITLAR